jgi:hypothetical protein
MKRSLVMLPMESSVLGRERYMLSGARVVFAPLVIAPDMLDMPVLPCYMSAVMIVVELFAMAAVVRIPCSLEAEVEIESRRRQITMVKHTRALSIDDDDDAEERVRVVMANRS